MKLKTVAVTSTIAVSAMLLAGCSAPAEDSSEVSLKYILWDSTQQPAYQQCADSFTTKTGISIDIQQMDWDAYWSGLLSDLSAGTGPDVFTNVDRNYPDFVRQKAILDLTPMIEEDKLDLSSFIPATLTNWKMDGSYYGLPKDISAMGLAFNVEVVESAGIDPEELAAERLTWNPTDGGTFGELIKKLTLDSSGRNGLDPAFDKKNVVRWGLNAVDTGGIDGEMTWGNLAAGNGAELLTPNPFGTEWNLDSPAVVDTLKWYQQMAQDGYIQPATLNASVGAVQLLEGGQLAMTMDGTWTAAAYAQLKVPTLWTAMPAGPEGPRTYSSSLGDSINAATKHPEESWEWVKYLASAECQDQVAEHAVVVPALASSAEKAIDAYAAKGIPAQPLLNDISTPGVPVSLPVTLSFNKAVDFANPAYEDIFLNYADVDGTMKALNDEVNALYK